MAIRVIEDRVLGASYHQDENGVQLRRIFVARGLVPQTNTLASGATATDPATGVFVPAYGQPHPLAPGLYVTSVDGEPFLNSKTSAVYTVTYGWRVYGTDAIQVRLTGSTITLAQNYDPDTGKFFKVTYTDEDGNVGISPVTMSVDTVELCLEVTRLENSNPLVLIAAVQGRTNVADYQGLAPYQWMLRSVQAEAVAQGRYLVTYQFVARPLVGWSQLYYYVDHYTGKPPENILVNADVSRATVEGQNGQLGNGVFVKSPPTADFAQLGLPSVYQPPPPPP